MRLYKGFNSVRNPPFSQRLAPRTLQFTNNPGWGNHDQKPGTATTGLPRQNKLQPFYQHSCLQQPAQRWVLASAGVWNLTWTFWGLSSMSLSSPVRGVVDASSPVDCGGAVGDPGVRADCRRPGLRSVRRGDPDPPRRARRPRLWDVAKGLHLPFAFFASSMFFVTASRIEAFVFSSSP